MLEGIIIVVVSASAIGIVRWLVRSLFVLRPKVRIAYAPGGGGSCAGTDTQLRLTWDYRLVLRNDSKHHALNLQLVYASDHVVSSLTVAHLEGLKEAKVEEKLTKLVDRDTVVRGGHDFHGVLLPPELRDMTICLRYKNETGFRFYTLYKKTGDAEDNSYHFRQPELGVS